MAERYIVRLGYELKQVEVEEAAQGFRVRINGEWHDATFEQVGQSSLYALLIDGRPHELFAAERAEGYDIVIGWDRYSVGVSERDQRMPPQRPGGETVEEHPAGGWIVLSPLTGVVLEVRAKVGDQVSEGSVLMVIEAMKMNNELRAQKAGTVREVYVETGQRVEPGMSLLAID